MSSKSKYLSSLDGLRGISIIQVLLFHLSVYHGGTFMIQGFMVQSGYLITLILLKNQSKNLSNKDYLKVFHVNRFLRILPLYFMYIIICIIIYLIYGIDKGVWEKAIHLFTFNFNNFRMMDGWNHDPTFTHLWTMSLDMQFYLIWPFVVLFLNRRNLILVILTFLIMTPLIRFGTGVYLGDIGKSSFFIGNSIYTFSLSHFDAFMIGSLVPLIEWDRFLKTHFIPFVLGFILLFVGGLVNHYLIKKGMYSSFWKDLGYKFSGTKNLQYVWNYSVANIFFFILVVILSSELSSRTKMILSKFLEFKPFTFLGKYTFGIYIFHGILITLVQKLGLFNDKWLASLIVFGGSISLAMLSYHFYEKQFLKRKIRL